MTRMSKHAASLVLAGLAVLLLAGASPAEAASADRPAVHRRQQPFVVRPLHPWSGERWIGNAIAYGPHRDGQHPGGPSPTREQLREDLHLMAARWPLIRIYNSVGAADTILDVIRQDRLDMKVMLGAWIAPEETAAAPGAPRRRNPEAAAANRREVDAAVRLAAAYPDIVLAIAVSNETQIFWSAHRVPAPMLVRYVREVRARCTVPVTVADDFNFWNKPASRALARELDFVVTHMHPLWNGLQLEDALDWTQKQFAAVRAFHPDREVVLGETGWATQRLYEGEQGKLMHGKVGEAEQKTFCDAVAAWARRERIVAFLFEAFDENWKGGPNPGEVEKHWGLFRADRSPKLAAGD